MARISDEPFFPTDRPRSWLLALIFVLAALLVVAPLQFILQSTPAAPCISVVFVGLVVSAGGSFLFYMVRSVLGHYSAFADSAMATAAVVAWHRSFG